MQILLEGLTKYTLFPASTVEAKFTDHSFTVSGLVRYDTVVPSSVMSEKPVTLIVFFVK